MTRSGHACRGAEIVSLSELEAIVSDGRLNVLCCLLDSGPLSVPQIGARLGESSRTVRYWVHLLDSFCLVERLGDLAEGEPPYAASLHGHSDWIRDAVEGHRAKETRR